MILRFTRGVGDLQFSFLLCLSTLFNTFSGGVGKLLHVFGVLDGAQGICFDPAASVLFWCAVDFDRLEQMSVESHSRWERECDCEAN